MERANESTRSVSPIFLTLSRRYKFSKGVGLSYKFFNNNVLERLPFEDQNPDRFKF